MRLRPRHPKLRTSRPARLLFLLAGTAACAEPGPARFTARDSSAIRIVEIPAATMVEPVLSIGDPVFEPVEATGVATEFGSIADAERLNDGSVVIADGRLSELRAFGPDGAPLWRSGRAGDGPGEYRLIQAIGGGSPDSIWVYDFGLRRFTILDASGATARVLPLTTDLSAVLAAGRLDDGRFVLHESWSTRSQAGASDAGLRRDPVAVATLSADGRALDTVATPPGREVHLHSEGGRAVMSAPLFARSTMVRATGASFAIGDPVRFELDVLDGDGAIRRIVRVSGLRLDLDAAMLRAEAERRAADLAEPERAARVRELLDMQAPASRPAFLDIVLAKNGALLVAQDTDGNTTVWWRFDATGAPAGALALPARIDVLRFGPDWILGIERDAFDAETVRVWPLVVAGRDP